MKTEKRKWNEFDNSRMDDTRRTEKQGTAGGGRKKGKWKRKGGRKGEGREEVGGKGQHSAWGWCSPIWSERHFYINFRGWRVGVGVGEVRGLREWACGGHVACSKEGDGDAWGRDWRG